MQLLLDFVCTLRCCHVVVLLSLVMITGCMYGVSVGICPLLPKYQLLTIAYPFNQKNRSSALARASTNAAKSFLRPKQRSFTRARSTFHRPLASQVELKSPLHVDQNHS